MPIYFSGTRIYFFRPHVEIVILRKYGTLHWIEKKELGTCSDNTEEEGQKITVI